MRRGTATVSATGSRLAPFAGASAVSWALTALLGAQGIQSVLDSDGEETGGPGGKRPSGIRAIRRAGWNRQAT